MKKIRVKWSGHDLDLLALAVIERAGLDASGRPGEERDAARSWLDEVGKDWLDILGVRRRRSGEQKRGNDAQTKGG